MELEGNSSINFYKQVAPTGLFLEDIIFITGGEHLGMIHDRLP
jgi:hypothetical protein